MTTVGWLIVTYVTRPTDDDTLLNFCKVIHPGGSGWRKVKNIARQRGIAMNEMEDEAWRVPQGIICMVLGCIFIYGILLATGYWIYGKILPQLVCL